MLRVHLLLAAVVVPAYVAMPLGLPRAVANSLVGLGCVVVMGWGIRRHRPRGAWAWWLIAAGVLAWTVGDLAYSLLDLVLHVDPFPSVADVVYLAAYPLFASGVWWIARSRGGGRDRGSLLDSAIVTVGLGFLSWVFLVRPALADTSAPWVARIVLAGYPLGDVLLLAFLVRLLTSGGGRSVAFRFLAAGLVLGLVTDSAYQVLSLTGDYHGGILNLGWSWCYAAFAAAALHPSVRTLADAVPTAPTVGRARLTALATAGLLAPCTLLVQLALGLPPSAWSVGACSVVLFLLVVLRMAGLLRQLQEQAAGLSTVSRTDPLTGIANRRSADFELGRLLDRCAAGGGPLVLGILDLDHFKQFNDTHGHPAGDQLLVRATRAWSTVLSGEPVFLARWGGEEFLVAISGRPLSSGVDLFRSLRAVTPLGQTFSMGLAEWDGHQGVDDLVQRADTALYAAKAAGRDRVVCFVEEMAVEEMAGAEIVPARPGDRLSGGHRRIG